MNYIELYKACKDYADFVERHFNKVNALNDIVTNTNAESYFDFEASTHFNFIEDGHIIPKLLRKEDAVITPIRREIAESILATIDERHELMQKTASEVRAVEKIYKEPNLEVQINKEVNDEKDIDELFQEILNNYFGDTDV